MEFEKFYKDSCPEIVKVLLIGESPPAEEKNFFFFAPNADLYNFTKLAFEKVYGDKINEASNFLEFFKTKGFFLDDLCREPINDIKNEYQRETKRQNNISSLAKRLSGYNPAIVIGIMKKIQYHISEAIRMSKIEPRYIFYLGYPTHNKRNISNYVNGLENILRTLIKDGIIE